MRQSFNGTIQSNQFIEGMNMDMDYSVLSPNSYIYGENLRLSVDDKGTSAVISAIEGFTAINDGKPLTFTYYEYDKTTDSNNLKSAEFNTTHYHIIGVSNIRDIIILFTRNTIDNTNSIFRLTINDPNYTLHRIVTGEFDICNGEDRDFSIVTYWESSDVIKVYWADGVYAIRYINISSSADIKNYRNSVEQFDSTSKSGTGVPIFDSFTSGALNHGLFQYAYQLFDINGAETDISIMSDIIQLTKDNGLSYFIEGGPSDESSGRGIKIRFNIPDSTLVSCKVYRITYTDKSDLAKVNLVGEFEVTPQESDDGTLTQYFTDAGTSISEVTLEEFITAAQFRFVPRILESKDGRLFAGNIIESSWTEFNMDSWYDTRSFRFDGSNPETATSIIYSNSGDPLKIKAADFDLSDTEWLKLVPKTHDCLNSYNDFTDTDTIYNCKLDGTNSGNRILGGSGKNVDFQIVYTKFGHDYYDEFTGSDTSWKSKRKEFGGRSRRIDIKNCNDKKATTTIDIYDNPNGSKISDVDLGYKYLANGDINYSNPTLSGKFRSYQRDELYRTGAVFYNEKGQSSEVNWIADIRMPSILDDAKLFDQWEKIGTSVYQVVSYPMGIQFTFRNVPEYVTKIEIVRCKRDALNRRIVTQGLLSRTAKADNNGNKDGVKPTRPIINVSYNTGSGQYLTAAHRYGVGYGHDSHRPTHMQYIYTNDMFTLISPEIEYFGDEFFKDGISRLNHIQPVVGLASPIHKDVDPTWWWVERDLNEPNFNYVRDFTSQVYFSPLWGEGSVQASSGLGRGLTFFDGATGYSTKLGVPILWSAGFGDHTNGADNWECRSKYLAKLYTPFNKYNELKNVLTEKMSAKINDLTFAQGLLPEDYESIQQGEHIVTIGNNGYQNWTPDMQYYVWERIGKNDFKNKFKHGAYANSWVFTSTDLLDVYKPINMIGENSDENIRYSDYNGFTFEMDNLYSDTQYGAVNAKTRARAYSITSTFLTNVIQSHAMYGGLDYNGRSQSTYISTQSTGTPNDNELVVTAFGGDTFIGIADILSVGYHYYKSDVKPGENDMYHKWGNAAQIGTFFPCESSINLDVVHGETLKYHTNKVCYNKESANMNWNHNVYNNPNRPDDYDATRIVPHELSREPWIAVSEMFTQKKPYYAYNSVYSAEPDGKRFVQSGRYHKDNMHYDYRVMYSELKQNEEIADNWLKFKPANYLDLDTRFGSINNMKLFNNTLYFWQDSAFGVLPINERTLLQDNDFAGLLIGKGDVLSNYQYITHANGSKKDVLYNISTSPSTLYWYDHDRYELMAMSESLISIGKQSNIQSWFNAEHPNISNRIRTMYDKKYNEVLFSFTDSNIQSSPNTLVYSELMRASSGFNTYTPDWFVNNTTQNYVIKNNCLYNIYGGPNNTFYSEQYPSKLHYVVNQDYAETKVFDNVNYYAEFDNGNRLSFLFDTKSHTSRPIAINDVIELEDSYRFAIPRNQDSSKTFSTILPSSEERLRGKYLKSYLTYTPNEKDRVFKLPYIRTAYRKSNI